MTWGHGFACGHVVVAKTSLRRAFGRRTAMELIRGADWGWRRCGEEARPWREIESNFTYFMDRTSRAFSLFFFPALWMESARAGMPNSAAR